MANGRNKNKKNILNNNGLWSLYVTLLSFLISIVLMIISTKIFSDTKLYVAIIVVLIIVLTGVIFDLIGVAVTYTTEAPFNSMASKKIKGAKRAIKLVRNASRVSSVCNDVVGDICGVISGAASSLIIIYIGGQIGNGEISLEQIIISGIVAALTVGGKAVGKIVATKNAIPIVLQAAKILDFFSFRSKA